VLGGTGVGTPTLIDAVATAVQAGRLPRTELRLHGREMTRARGLIRYACQTSPGVGAKGDPATLVREAPTLEESLKGCDVVLCLVRPGGMAGRAADERMVLAEGLPGDEGIGPSGLASYLRSRPVLESIKTAWQSHAPHAPFLQLTSPLGLATGHMARDGGMVLGLCELPQTTSRAIRSAVEPTLGPIHHAHFGLNHCAWLYDFKDRDGRDRTADVIRICGQRSLLPVGTEQALQDGAVPLPHLRMFYDTGAVVCEQLARPVTRGEELIEWCSALHDAYCAPSGVDVGFISSMLARRRMDWHLEAVIPALEVWCNELPARLTVNVDGIVPGVVVEAPCIVGKNGIDPVGQEPLPPGPDRLFQQLTTYERAVLALPQEPTARDIAEVLELHPLMLTDAVALRLGERIVEGIVEGRFCS
jgi:6-phospho-beta-glucosidase